MNQLSGAEVQDEPLAWPITDHQVLGHGFVSDFVNDTVTLPDGGSMQRQYLLHPGAVGIIAWDAEDRIAVVRQYRHPVGFRLVEPPAGLLDSAGESSLLAAQRELAEEARLQAADWRVLVDLYTTPGACQESLRIFLARALSPAPVPDGFVADHEEAFMDLSWVARADLVAAVLAGRLQNPTMVSGVMALEVARLSGQLDALRAPDSVWPARKAWAERNQALADLHGSLD